MDLKLIKETSCPHCNARTIAESCRSVHCNGQGFEERHFECGHILAWSPNAERLEVKAPCPKSKEEVAKKDSRVRASDLLLAFLAKLNVDEDWKRYVMRGLPHEVAQRRKFLKLDLPEPW